MTNFERLHNASCEQLAQFLARIYYLNCDHDKKTSVVGACWQCPVGYGCKTAKRSHSANLAYRKLREEFFSDTNKRKENKCGFGYAGTVEKEFRDTIPSEMWLEMTITVGDCTKEILAWLQKETETELCMKGNFNE